MAENRKDHASKSIPGKANPKQNETEASLVEVLQALAADMAKAESDAEAEAGLKRLRQIRTEFLGSADRNAAAAEARRNAEALISWLEERLERLRQLLARKRRVQEGQVMEQIAKQREAEGPTLLPTELIDAVVHSTDAKDPDEPTTSAPRKEPEKKKDGPAEQEPSKEKKEKTEAEDPAAAYDPAKQPEPPKPEEPVKQPEPPKPEGPEQQPDLPKPEEPEMQPEAPKPEEPEQQHEPPKPEEPEQQHEPPKPEEPVKQPEPPKPADSPGNEPPAERPAAKGQAEEKPEWTKSERLVAHMAASVREDPKFFDKLRKGAKRGGPKQQASADDPKAEAHFRTVRDLGKRLVNLELHAKAIAKAKERREPVAQLMKTAARELKSFMREFKAAKQDRPELAEDYDRRFGGYAEQFAAMKPEKGRELLDQCRAERQPKPDWKAEAPAAEQDAPQLVLKRDDYWQQ